MNQRLLPLDNFTSPQNQSVLGWIDLAKQSECMERHIPITPERIDEYRFILRCIERGAVIYPDEVPTWDAIVTRFESCEVGNSEFLSSQELELINCFVNYREELAESWRQIHGKRLIGETGLVWRWMEESKEYHPAIHGTRFPKDSLLTLSWHYLESCLAPERQPMRLSCEGLIERLEILNEIKVIRCNESLEGVTRPDEARRFLRSLLERYPPPPTEGPGHIDNGRPSRSQRLMPWAKSALKEQ